MTDLTKEDLFKKATHVECQMCGARASIVEDLCATDGLKNEADLDSMYDLMGCCDDPLLDAMIVLSHPLGISADGDYYVAEFHGQPQHWEYTLGDDFFAQAGVTE